MKEHIRVLSDGNRRDHEIINTNKEQNINLKDENERLNQQIKGLQEEATSRRTEH